MSEIQKDLFRFAENFPIQQMPGFFNIMTLNSEYIAINQQTLNLVGCKDPDSLLLKSYEFLPCKAAESAAIFQEEDRKVIQQGVSKRILSYQCFADNSWLILLGEKAPVFNKNRDIIGTTSQFIDVTHLNLIDLGRFIVNAGHSSPNFTQKQFSFALLPKNNAAHLTPRQSECLFFTIRGYSSAMIAKMLSISLRTVHDHIEELKAKFQCSNKMMLIEKAIHEGYINTLPESLIGKKLL